ncbi:MAG: leucine-rich repeat domain-containing protein [Oscillospiraceae bacterium]|nr:leucine-rich repeat domain-containing protein [Oscillospiraceae bacterium]
MKIPKILAGAVASAVVATSTTIYQSDFEKEYLSFSVYAESAEEPIIYECKTDYGYIYYSLENGNATIHNISFTEKNITEFTVPAEVNGYPITALGNETFAYMNNIEGIIVPEYIKEIGKGTFYTQSGNSLKWIRIENRDLIIPPDAQPFGYTTTVYGKENSTAQFMAYKCGTYFIDYEKRVEHNGLTGQIVDNTVTIIACDTDAVDVTVPEMIDNLPVTAIERMAFYDCRSLKSISIPNCVTTINDDAFLCCTQLTDVRLPETLTELPESCFQSCTSLKSIELPDTVKKIGSSAFAGCSSLENINITDRIEYIGTNAFSGTLWIENYSDENNLVIVNGFLQDGKNFIGENLVIPDGVKYISDYAFQSMDNLKTVTFPDSLKVIEEDCFSYCTNLTSVSFPDTLEQIGDNAFKGCTNLDDVIFPEALTELGYQSFAECKTLSQIKIPEKITDIDSNCFNNCTNLKKILLPQNLKSIGYMSFMNCVNLDRIDIPDSVENIDDSAFGNCIKLENIHLPYSLKKIGDYAFDGCTLLTEISFPSEKEFKMCSTSFKDTPWLENMQKNILRL